MRVTQAEAGAWQRSADAATRYDHTQAINAKTLASQLAAERQQLEAANARYEQWSAATSTRETAAKARAELERRGLAREHAEPSQPRAVNEPEVDNAVDPNIDREHQVAAGMREPQPPERALTPQHDAAAAQEPDGRLGPDHQVARADELLGQAAAAAGRIAAERAERQARAEYIAAPIVKPSAAGAHFGDTGTVRRGDGAISQPVLALRGQDRTGQCQGCFRVDRYPQSHAHNGVRVERWLSGSRGSTV